MQTIRNKTVAILIAALSLVAATRSAHAADVSSLKTNPAAWALLKSAHDSRQTFPAGFKGFSADLVFDEDGKQMTGTVTYQPGEPLKLKIEGLTDDQNDWLQDQAQSVISHRQADDFAKGEGKDPITFGPGPANPWGRLVVLNDTLQSTYRVRDIGNGPEIAEVTRTMGGSRFTISVLESRPGDDGKYLPVHFIVGYRDAATGALQQVQGFRDAYQKFDGGAAGNVWIPSRRMVIFFEEKNDSPRVRTISFRNPKPIAP